MNDLPSDDWSGEVAFLIGRRGHPSRFVSQAQWIAEVESRLAEIENHLHEVVANLEVTRSRMEAAITSLDLPVSEVPAQEEGRRQPPPTTRDGIHHHEIGAAYQALLDGALRDLLNLLCRRQFITGARDTAEMAAALCRSAFDGDDVNEQTAAVVLGEVGVRHEDNEVVERLDAFLATAADIRSRACRAGRDQRWGFDHVLGAPVDEDRQVLWSTADPDGRVAFVVAPAYIVEARLIIVKQLVFTASAVDWERSKVPRHGRDVCMDSASETSEIPTAG